MLNPLSSVVAINSKFSIEVIWFYSADFDFDF